MKKLFTLIFLETILMTNIEGRAYACREATEAAELDLRLIFTGNP